MLEGSELVIEEAPAVVYCENCEAERSLSSIQAFICPVCSTPAPKVIRGRELELVAMEIN